MSDQRVIELEIKLSYQEDLLQALNKIVADQQRQITHLERAYQHLNERINSLPIDNKSDSANEPPPPHY